jgi:hypothetical protein
MSEHLEHRPSPPVEEKSYKETRDARNALSPSIQRAWEAFHGTPVMSDQFRKETAPHLPVLDPLVKDVASVSEKAAAAVKKSVEAHGVGTFEQIATLNATMIQQQRIKQNADPTLRADVVTTRVTMMREVIWRMLPRAIDRSLRTMDRYATLRQRFPGVPVNTRLEQEATRHMERLDTAMRWRMMIAHAYRGLDNGGPTSLMFTAARKGLVEQQPAYAPRIQQLIKERTADTVSALGTGAAAKKEAAGIMAESQAFLKDYETNSKSLLDVMNRPGATEAQIRTALDAVENDAMYVLIQTLNAQPDPAFDVYRDFLNRSLAWHAEQTNKLSLQEASDARDKQLKALATTRQEILKEQGTLFLEAGQGYINEMLAVSTPEALLKFEGDAKVKAGAKRTAENAAKLRKELHGHHDSLIRGFQSHFSAMVEGDRKTPGVLSSTFDLRMQDIWNEGGGRQKFVQMLDFLVQIRAWLRPGTIPRLFLGTAEASNEKFRQEAMDPILIAMGFPPGFHINDEASWKALSPTQRKLIEERGHSVLGNINRMGPQVRERMQALQGNIGVLQGLRSRAAFDELQGVRPDPEWLARTSIDEAAIKTLPARCTTDADKGKLLAAYLVLYGQMRGNWDAYMKVLNELSDANGKVLETHLNLVVGARDGGRAVGPDWIAYVVLGAAWVYGGNRVLASVWPGGRFGMMNPLRLPNAPLRAGVNLWEGGAWLYRRVRGNPAAGAVELLGDAAVTIDDLRKVASELSDARRALGRARGTGNAGAAMAEVERQAIRFRDMLNSYRPVAGGPTQDMLRMQFLQEFTGINIIGGPHAAVRQELLRRAHTLGTAVEGMPHSADLARQKKWILEGWDPTSAPPGGRPTRRLMIGGSEVTAEMAFTAPQSNVIVRTGLAGQTAIAEAAGESVSVVRGVFASKEWGELAGRMRAPGANISAILEESRELVGLSAREARLIAQSRSAQRVFAAATTAEEIGEAVRLAKRAATFRVVGHVASGALDIFGIVMAYVAFQENAHNIEMARRTGNGALADFYRDAQVINVMEGGVATVGLVCSGIAIYGSATGSTCMVCSAGAFVSGSVMLPLGIGMAMAAPYRASLDRAAETFLRNPQDWAQKTPGEILSELERLSRAQYTWGEMASTATNIELAWNWGTSNDQEYQKWWQQRMGVLEGGARGTRANLCAAYLIQTTHLPRRENESQGDHDRRIRDHIAAQMQYMNTLTRGGYDVYFAQHFRAAKHYADLVMQSREPSNTQSFTINVDGTEHRVNVSDLLTLPFRAGEGGAVSQQMVLEAYMTQQRSSQLLNLSEMNVPQRTESLFQSQTRLSNTQRELHGMFLGDINADLDRFAARVEATDFDGVDFLFWSGESNARAVIRYGVSKRLEAVMKRAEMSMIARGTFDPEEYQKFLDEMRAILASRTGPALQKLHNEFAADPALLKAAVAARATSAQFVDIRSFQTPPSLDIHTPQFIENIGIPEILELPTLPAATPATFEEAEIAELRTRHQSLTKRREWLETDHKDLLAAARGGTLGAEPTSEMPYNWQREQRAQRRVVNLTRTIAQLDDDQRQLMVRANRFLESVNGPDREGYRRTRDLEAALRPTLRRENFQRFAPGETLFQDSEAVPHVRGINVTNADLPVLEETIAALREEAPRLWPMFPDPLGPRNLRGINIVKEAGTATPSRYLVSFILQQGGISQCVHVAVERSADTVTIGSFAVTNPSEKSWADMPYPAINETANIREALGTTPIVASTSDESGALYRRVLSINPAEMATEDRTVYEAARRRYGPETTVLAGCTETDVAALTDVVPRLPLGWGADPVIGLQIQGRGAEAAAKSGSRDFLVTYAGANGTGYEFGIRIEEDGTARLGAMRRVDTPGPLRTVLAAREATRGSVADAWRSGQRVEVGRDEAGRQIYAMRYGNSMILHRYVDGPPGTPPQMQYQVIPVVGAGEAEPSQERLVDVVRKNVQEASKAASWTPIENGGSYRQAALKGYRAGMPGGDVRLDNANAMMIHLLALPRPGAGGAAGETPDQTVGRVLDTLGIHPADPAERARMTEMYQSVLTEAGAGDAHFMLQAMAERMAVQQEQTLTGQPAVDAYGLMGQMVQRHLSRRLDAGMPGLFTAAHGTLFPNDTQRQEFQKQLSAVMARLRDMPNPGNLREETRTELTQRLSKLFTDRAGRPFDPSEISLLTHQLQQAAFAPDLKVFVESVRTIATGPDIIPGLPR